MYSAIFQISKKPISENDFLQINYLEDTIPDADYICNVENRYDSIRQMTNGWCNELFDLDDLDNGSLIFKGLGTFLNDWVNVIRVLANDMDQDNIFKNFKLYNLKGIIERSHKNIYTRFYINDWYESAGTFADLIEFLNGMEAGSRLYIGAIYEYHH